MAKCEAIDLTLSDSDSDDDLIQAKKAVSVSSFCILHDSSFCTSSFCLYIKFLLQWKLFHGSRACT